MRIETVKRELYSYDELSDDAKEKARDWYRGGAFDFEWWFDAVYDAKQIGALMGIDIDEVYFSGFWSQGDGACFTGEYRYKKGSVAAIKKEFPTDKELHYIAENLAAIQRQNF